MKKLLVLIAALPFVFASCGGNVAEEIVGTWKFAEVGFDVEGTLAEEAESTLAAEFKDPDDFMGDEITFLADGTVYIDDDSDDTRPYEVKGDEVIINAGRESMTFKVKISGQDIQLTMDFSKYILNFMGIDDSLSALTGTVTKGAIDKAEIYLKGTKK